MRSRLYECRIVHRRLAPTQHHFAYRVFFAALDLDELPELHRRLRLFSVESGNLYSLRSRDYLPIPRKDVDSRGVSALVAGAPGGPLRERVVEFGLQRGVDLARAKIELITFPRILGYGFNPVSFYFCRSAAGVPLGAIAEVTNTFGEVKPFWLSAESYQRGAYRLRLPKHFYVSPFSDVDVEFDFRLRAPDENLALQIDDFTDGKKTLGSTVIGTARELSDLRLAWYTLKYPALTLRVILLIHWHALRLYLKRTPWFRKAERASDQRDLFRPHRLSRGETT